ncbi:MAG TPA: hypothetical protein VJY42_05060 [Candidatus Methanomethylophilaceae archaeon]|nr:hypothetical protein [Candidatus Methanomethylophilaceae archaeon]
MIPLVIVAVVLLEAAGIGITAYSIYDSHKIQQSIIDSNNAVMDAIDQLPAHLDLIYYTFTYGIDFWTMLTECWVQIWLIVVMLFIAYMIIHPGKQKQKYGGI